MPSPRPILSHHAPVRHTIHRLTAAHSAHIRPPAPYMLHLYPSPPSPFAYGQAPHGKGPSTDPTLAFPSELNNPPPRAPIRSRQRPKMGPKDGSHLRSRQPGQPRALLRTKYFHTSLRHSRLMHTTQQPHPSQARTSTDHGHNQFPTEGHQLRLPLASGRLSALPSGTCRSHGPLSWSHVVLFLGTRKKRCRVKQSGLRGNGVASTLLGRYFTLPTRRSSVVRGLSILGGTPGREPGFPVFSRRTMKVHSDHIREHGT